MKQKVLRSLLGERRPKTILRALVAAIATAIAVLLHRKLEIQWAEASVDYLVSVVELIVDAIADSPLRSWVLFILSLETALALQWCEDKYRRSKNRYVPPAKTRQVLIADEPIKESSQDLLGFDYALSHLPELLTRPIDSPSLVIAIDSKWGTGKTSALSLITQRINVKEFPPLIFPFFPWILQTRDSILQVFLIQLAKLIEDDLAHRGFIDLADETRDAFRSLVAFVPLMLGLPNTSEWDEAINNSLKSGDTSVPPNLHAAKERVQSAITAAQRPIVIIIDDIDRLTDDEVKTVVQVIRAVCDFRGVTYLIAMDSLRVAESLGDGNEEKGRAYLEKIIQASIRLPAPSNSARATQILRRFRDAFNPTPDAGVDAELERAARIVATLVDTQRDVVRIINQCVINFRHKTIFLPDVLVFETLAVRAPALIESIRVNARQFAQFSGRDDNDDWLSDLKTAEARQNDRNEALSKALDSVPLKLKAASERGIKFLFPAAFGDDSSIINLNPHVYDRIELYPKLMEILDIAGESYGYAAQDGKTVANDPAGRLSIIEKYVLSEANAGFIVFCGHFCRSESVQQPGDLATALLLVARKAFDAGITAASSTAATVLAMFENKLIETQDKRNILRIAATDAESLSTSEKIVLELAREVRLWSNGNRLKLLPTLSIYGISSEEILNAMQLWVAATKNKATCVGLFLTEEDPISIYFRWVQFSDDPLEAQLMFAKELDEPQRVKILLEHFSGAYGVDGFHKLYPDPPEFMKKIESYRGEFPRAVRKFEQLAFGNAEIDRGADTL